MSADLRAILLDVKRSDRDICGVNKKRGDLFSKRIGNALSGDAKAGVRSVDLDTQAEGYRDAVRELELQHGMLPEGAYRKTFGVEPKPLKPTRKR